MPAPRKYPQELRERVMRLVSEARQEDPELSVHQAVVRIGSRVGVNAHTLRGWCRQVGTRGVRSVVGTVRRATGHAW
jgi:transposase